MKKCVKCGNETSLRSWCKPCRNEYNRIYRKKNAESKRIYERTYRAKNRDKIRAYANKYYCEKFRPKVYWPHLSLDEAVLELKKLIDKQDGKCAICFSRAKLVVDHCHETTMVRGLLCQSCNHGLGNFKDRADFLFSAINYIQKKAI